jgi:glycosyltransferase involved in cell wall biosynthesis
MKIAAVTPMYPPGSRVGSWLSTHECLRVLLAAGHDVVANPMMVNNLDEYVLDGVRVVPGSVRMDEVIGGADLVISHLGDPGHAHRAALNRGIPSVRMVHGLIGQDALRQLAAYPPDLIVFNSESSAATARHRCPHIVVNPIFDRQDFATTPGDLVTQVNQSDPKGGQMFQKLVRFMPDVGFLAVRGGYGKQRDMVGRNVETLAPTQDMRGDVYSRTRVLLIPSKAETWGMVGVEAMCSGIPVMASPTPGLVESLGDAGIFVADNNFKGWMSELRRLLDPVEWSAASARSLARVAELDPYEGAVRFVKAIEGLGR